MSSAANSVPAVRFAAAPRSAVNETAFFTALILVGLHTGLSLVRGQQVIAPYFLAFLSSFCVITINIRRVSDDTLKAFLILASTALFLALFVSQRTDGMYVEHIRSSAMFVYSIVVGYGVYIGVTSMGARKVDEVFFYFALVLVVGAALEVYGPLRPVSDWFRQSFESWHSLYASDARDQMAYGALRPKFFASEPSILGTTTSLAICLWFVSGKRITFARVLGAAGLFVPAVFFIRSPTLFFAPIASFLILLAMTAPRRPFLKFVRGAIFVGFFGMAVAIPSVAAFLVFKTHMAPRYIMTSSFFEREIAPFLMAIDVLRSNPLFGLGTGNLDAMIQEATKVLIKTGLINIAPQYANANLGALIGNAFWQFWIAFGVGGGAALIWNLSSVLKTIRSPVSIFLVFGITAGTYWQGFGGPNIPMDWFCFFAIAGLCALRRDMAVAEARPGRAETGAVL